MFSSKISQISLFAFFTHLWFRFLNIWKWIFDFSKVRNWFLDSRKIISICINSAVFSRQIFELIHTILTFEKCFRIHSIISTIISVGKFSFQNKNFHEKGQNIDPDVKNKFTRFNGRFYSQFWIVKQTNPRDIRKVYLRFGHFLILETLWMISVKVVIICSCVCSRPRALF